MFDQATRSRFRRKGIAVLIALGLAAGMGVGGVASASAEVIEEPLIEVVPEIPVYTLPACEGDKYIPPTVELPTGSDGIHYQWGRRGEPPVDPEIVDVEARLNPGYVFAEELPAGWRAEEGGRNAYWEIAFEDVPCTPPVVEVVPEIPVYTLPACEGDEYIPPTLALPEDTDALDYRWDSEYDAPPFEVPVLVTIVAWLRPGYAFADELPGGWRSGVDWEYARWSVRFEDVPCAPHDIRVGPVTPEVVPEKCVDGEWVAPRVIPAPDGNGITYHIVERDVRSVIWVQARPMDGYRLDPELFPEGWMTEWLPNSYYEVTFDPDMCDGLAGVNAGGVQSEGVARLAATGAAAPIVPAAAALLSIAAGASLIAARRHAASR